MTVEMRAQLPPAWYSRGGNLSQEGKEHCNLLAALLEKYGMRVEFVRYNA